MQLHLLGAVSRSHGEDLASVPHIYMLKAEHAIFAAATLAIWVHLLDTVIEGTEKGWLFGGAVLLGALTAIAAVDYSRLPPLVRPAVSIVLGATWLAGGTVNHVVPLATRGAHATDVTGVLLTAGGLMQVALGLAVASRVARPPGTDRSDEGSVRRPRGRW